MKIREDGTADPRFMTAEEVSAALSPILGSAEVGIARKDRHQPDSEILMLIIDVDSLTYDAMTQVAGLFETPNIIIGSKLEDVDADRAYEIAKGNANWPCSRVQLKVRL